MLIEKQTRKLIQEFVEALNAEIDRIQYKIRNEKLLRSELLNLMNDIEAMKLMMDEIELRLLFNSRIHG